MNMAFPIVLVMRAETTLKGCVESQEDVRQELDEKTPQNDDNIPNNVSEDVAEQWKKKVTTMKMFALLVMW